MIMFVIIYKLTEEPVLRISFSELITCCGKYECWGSVQWSNQPVQNSVTKSGPPRVTRLRSPRVCEGIESAPKLTVRKTPSMISLLIANRLQNEIKKDGFK